MTFEQSLRSGRTLVMDGAMGTELLRRGHVGSSALADETMVANIHADYQAAGAEVVLANTFLMTRADDIGRAIALARRAAPNTWVLASFALAQSPIAVESIDADAILLETCSDDSVFRTIDTIRSIRPDLPVLLSFSFAPGEDDKAVRLASRTRASDILALGVNCGRDQTPADVGRTLRLFQTETSLPLFARPNAGTPKPIADAWAHPLEPGRWADETANLQELGLVMLGGCCGTTPDHIRELRDRLA